MVVPVASMGKQFVIVTSVDSGTLMLHVLLFWHGLRISVFTAFCSDVHKPFPTVVQIPSSKLPIVAFLMLIRVSVGQSIWSILASEVPRHCVLSTVGQIKTWSVMRTISCFVLCQ